jgi:uncharacterized protein YecE (DUF72 family)
MGPSNPFMAKRWTRLNANDFRFSAKFPRSITHEKRLVDLKDNNFAILFFDVMRPLHSRVLALLLQLLPSLTAKEGLKKLQALTHMLDPEFRYAIR